MTALYERGSSHRVFNVLKMNKLADRDIDPAGGRLFTNDILEHSIILKHRVRPNEQSLFLNNTVNATKILIPFDHTELRSGAWSIFIGERNFENAINNIDGVDLSVGTRDREILELLDSLPSLDPFLMREKLRENGYVVAERYFSLSEADLRGMFEYTRDQLAILANMSSGSDLSRKEYGRRLADKLLSATPSEELGVLRSALHMTPDEYAEGIFAWKGFLYYSWSYESLKSGIGPFVSSLNKVEPVSYSSTESREFIRSSKRKLFEAITSGMYDIEAVVQNYRAAYAALTIDEDPTTFRRFLLSAPSLFIELGDLIGRLQHIYSFWNYRFPSNRPSRVSDSELIEIIYDFDESLGFLDY